MSITDRFTGGALRALLLGFALAALGSLAATRPAVAQNGPMFGLTVAINYGFLGGEDLDLLDDAIGFETIGSLAFPSGLELGAGVGISSHDIDPGSADASLTTVFADGRYRFNVPAGEVRHFHPFIGGRLGYASLGADPSGPGIDDDESVSGLLFGFGGGLEYWLSESVGLDGGAQLNFLSLENDVGGTKFDIRAGVKVRF